MGGTPGIPLPRVATGRDATASRRKLFSSFGLAGVGVAAARATVVVDDFAKDAMNSNVRIADTCLEGPGFEDVRRRPHVGEGEEGGGRVKGLHVGYDEIGLSRNVGDNL